MSNKPLILVTNDDGITANGIAALVDAVKDLGDVTVVAPDSPQSGMGHAITIAEPLRLERVSIFDGIVHAAYSCSGTPADCVKLAVSRVLYRKPDLVVSGINHGSNSSINVIYSGTMSAAVEAGIEGIPSIGFSLLNYSHAAEMDAARNIAHKIAKSALENKMRSGTILNVNIPYLHDQEIKGIKVCRQAKAKWVEEFEERTDPHNRKYYWLTGKFVNMDNEGNTDEEALANGYVSVVPIQTDLTAYNSIDYLTNEVFNEI